MATIRKQIIDLMAHGEWDARGLSQTLGIREKEVYAHLPHILRTLTAMGKTLKIIPAQCVACGYEFSARQKPSRPGRCPKCRQERIDSPRFKVTD